MEHKRAAVRGSPAVPGSNTKLYADKDNVVFCVVVLKKFLESYVWTVTYPVVDTVSLMVFFFVN